MENKYLYKIIHNYFSDNPLTAAHNLESLPINEAVDLFQQLPILLASKVLAELTPTFAAELVAKSDPQAIAAVLENSGSEACASIFLALPATQQETLIESLEENLREQVRTLLTFPVGSAGSIMRTNYTSFYSDATVKEALVKLKSQAGKKNPPSNLYIIGQNRELKGVLSMRDLVISPSTTKLTDIMKTEVLSVEPFADKQEAFNILSGRGFTSVPVLDAQKRLIGVVRATSLLEDAKQSVTEDIQKLFGAGKDERAFSPMFFAIKKRLPWLHVNLATAFLAASVVALFENIIAQLTILAVYLPVVAGQGGNAGAQSLAVVMRGLVMREIPVQDAKRLVIKESLVGVFNGLVIGLVTALIAWLWQGNPFLGLVIGLAMIVNLTVAGFSGAAIPLIMTRLKLDPAQSSSIILTTVTDVIGFFSFLGFAVIFKSLLI